jgi:hypothetical protein
MRVSGNSGRLPEADYAHLVTAAHPSTRRRHRPWTFNPCNRTAMAEAPARAPS